MRNTLLLVVASALVPGCAFATDGVVLINQAKVSAAGGFPYRITESGSYKLSGNLTGIPARTNAIVVIADYVTIDLNGFAIFGPGKEDVGNGISWDSTPGAPHIATHTTVINGSVLGMGIGIELDDFARVENVQAFGNGAGIVVGHNSIVTGNIVGYNDAGLIVDQDSIIRSNVSTNNINGIIAVCPSSIVGNSAANNTNIKISGGTSPGLADCTYSDNAPKP